MVLVAGFGNPLLDFTVKINEDTLLKKYNVQPNEMVEISKPQMDNLLVDIERLELTVTPGGGTQNTIRLIQWIINNPRSTIMYGAVGDDEHGKTLKTLVEEVGVETRYVVKPGIPTGMTIALVNQENRALLASIGAAQFVEIENLKSDNFLVNVDLVLIEAFFLTHRVPAASYIIKTCECNKIPFVFSLSSIYMTNMYTSDVLQLAEKCDVLLGNLDEYQALIQALNLQDDVKSFVMKLCKRHLHQSSSKYGKMCAITNGDKPALCIHSNGIIEREEFTPVSHDKLVDTTGAGDAFAAGFLCGYLKNHTPKVCLQWGCLLGKEIVQQTGCTIPKRNPNFLENMQ